MLSVFPFPKPSMGHILRHFMFILTLAETIDIVLLSTLDASKNLSLVDESSPKPAHTLLRLLSRPWQGLNRTLPINQPVRKVSSLIATLSWSFQETAGLIQTVDRFCASGRDLL